MLQKSIFKRYLSITMAIVILSFVMLGSVMMVFFGSYWKGEKKELLSKNAASISAMASVFLEEKSAGQFVLQTEVLKTFVATFSTSIDADLFITGRDGTVLIGNYPNSKIPPPTAISPEVVDQAGKGLYEGHGTLGDLYQNNFYSIGVPLMSKDGGTLVGAVFATTSASSVGAYQGEAFNIFLVAAAAALAITFCVVGAFAYRLVKPMRLMSVAARSFGAGDFSVRVPVTSADELGQLAVSFNNMANSLANSEGMRRSFIANVSHELKTPMTTIAGFIDGILDGTIPADQQRKYLDIVSSEVKRLSRLVKSMLDLSRIDNGEMKLQPVNFDMTHTIVNTLLTFEQAINEKELEIAGLDTVLAQMVWGDQDLLHQVVYNLIENAVKFTNPGGTISFTVSDGIDRTCVVIENTGPGIEPEDLPMIFDRFYKTDKSRSRDKNGMGLGLYIVRTIIKLHGGDICVTSVRDQFCRFEFYIPKPQEAPKLKDTGSFKLKEGAPKKKESRFTKEGGFRKKEGKKESIGGQEADIAPMETERKEDDHE